MQREFEMVVQTSAATQSFRYLLKSGDMTCITKGEITKRLEAAVLLQELSFQAVMTSGEVVEDMLENTYEDYDEALRDSLNASSSYGLYGVICVLAALFVWKMVPETKGKTLEDMTRLWKERAR